MTIPYTTFDAHIHALVLERGAKYYADGMVHDLKQLDDGWSGSVEGQDTYKVLLKGRAEVEDWNCSCPDTHGPVCKHVAALLHAIREKRNAALYAIEAMSELELREFLKSALLKWPELGEVLLAFGEEE